MTPRRKGTIVVPETTGGLSLFGQISGHKGHLVKIISTPRIKRFSNVGYVQDIRCVVDGQVFRGVDGEFLRNIAEKSDFWRLLKQIKQELEVLATGYDNIATILEG